MVSKELSSFIFLSENKQSKLKALHVNLYLIRNYLSEATLRSEEMRKILFLDSVKL